jgi:hypothetical protein
VTGEASKTILDSGLLPAAKPVGIIESQLAAHHLKNGALVLCDVTSTYLAGRCRPLARHG